MHLESMTWPEVAEAIAEDVPIVTPVGSLEQHGHHLPLGTDGFLPHALAERVGERRPLVIAPPILYAGRSHPRSGGGGSAFAGTTGLPGGLLADVLAQVAAEYVRHGFRHLVFINGHFENAAPLFEAVERAVEPHADRAKAVLINWWELIDDEDIEDAYPGDFPGWELEHAGVVETSLMEVLRPEMVHADRKTDGPPLRPRYDVVPTPAERIPPTGVPYRSTPASAEIGERLAARVVDAIEAILAEELGVPTPALDTRATS